MAKAKKLKSGSWNAVVYDYKDESGKEHFKSFTAPTKAECEFLAAAFKKDKKRRKKEPAKITVRQAIEKYIELSDLLSPTTLSGYRKILNYGFPSIMDVNVEDLDNIAAQEAINLEAKRKVTRTGKIISPKTVKNEWGLVSSALHVICKMSFDIKLPTVQQNAEELPDHRVVIQAIKGTSIELPCLLAMWMSLRMSEVRGLMCSSIRDGYLYVERVMVVVDGVDVLKSDAKTQSSKRRLKVPDYVMDLIEGQESYMRYKKTGTDELLFFCSRDLIYRRFKKAMKNVSINMSFHDLRHLYASISLNLLGLPQKVIQVSGGWSSSATMNKVYSQSFEQAQQIADNKREEYFNGIINNQDTKRRK